MMINVVPLRTVMRPLAMGFAMLETRAPKAPQSPVDALQDAAEPEPGDLLGAIERRDEAAAMSLLQRPRLPGLNVVDRFEGSVLHQALVRRLPEVAFGQG